MAGEGTELSEEKIELDRGDKGLGFNIKGGVDQPHIASNEGIFVTKIRDDGAAAIDGRLKKGDRILEINGTNVRSVQHSEAVDLFLSAGDEVVLVVQHGAEQAAQEALQGEEPKNPDPIEESGSGSSGRKWIVVGGVISVVLIFAIYYMRKTGK